MLASILVVLVLENIEGKHICRYDLSLSKVGNARHTSLSKLYK